MTVTKAAAPKPQPVEKKPDPPPAEPQAAPEPQPPAPQDDVEVSPAEEAEPAAGGAEPAAGEAEAPEEIDYESAVENVESYFDVFDNPGNPGDADGEIGEGDFDRIAEGDYDQEAAREYLEGQGLGGQELETALEEIEATAQFFADDENELYYHALRVADSESGEGRIERSDVDAALGDAEQFAAADERYAGLEAIENPQQAIEILSDYYALGDTAAGRGGADEEIGRADLEALANSEGAPEALRLAAGYLLADENEVIFNSIDAGAEGSANGTITPGNLNGAAENFANFGQETVEVNSFDDATQVLEDYFYLADSANGGGNGARDGGVSHSDLERLAESDALPDDLQAAARLLLDTQEASPEDLLALRPEFDPNLIELGHLQSYNDVPPEVRDILAEHSPDPGAFDDYIAIQDGRPVWTDTGEPISPEDYRVLADAVAAEEEPGYVTDQFGVDVTQVQEFYRSEFEDASGDVHGDYAAYAEEEARFGRFVAEYADILTPEQLAQAEQEHQARLDELGEPLEGSAGDFVELAEDPFFQEVFQDFDQETQAEFFETVADEVGVTEAGEEFANDLLDQITNVPEGGPGEDAHPFVQAAFNAVGDGKDAKKIRDAVTVLAARRLLNGGADSVDQYARVARIFYGADYAAEVRQALGGLVTAADQGTDAYRNARSALENFKRQGPAGALDFLAVGALALDAALVGQLGLDAVDGQFAFNIAKDSLDTASLASRLIRGSNAAGVLSRLGSGAGAIAAFFGGVGAIQEGDTTGIVANGLALAGYGLIAFGVGGPLGPVLLGASVLAQIAGPVLEGDPFENYVGDQLGNLGLDSDSLRLYYQLEDDAQQVILDRAEEFGLPPTAVAQYALSNLGGRFPRASVLEDVLADMLDPTAISTQSAQDLARVEELQNATGLSRDEALGLLGYVAQDDYLDFLEENPDDVLSLADYILEHIEELSERAPDLVDEAREAGAF